MSRLPASCAACTYHETKLGDDKGILRCHRHAPLPGVEEDEIVQWPPVKATARCMQGSDGTDPEQVLVPCHRCSAWVQPKGGLSPLYYGDKSDAWWAGAGHCIRLARGPSVTMGDAPAQWRVTHRTEGGCGDGIPIPAEE